MPLAEVNGIIMNYKVTGDGIPVILITGLLGEMNFWNKALTMIPEGYRTVTLDNRGVGKTVSEGPFTIQDMADDVAALSRKLELGPAHVLGWSMGSHIALDLAARYPELVRSLTIVSSYLRRPSRSEYILSSMADGLMKGTMSEETVGIFMNVLLRSESYFRAAETDGYRIRTMHIGNRDGMFRQMQSVRDYDPLEDAHSISLPAMSVHGLADIMAYPSCGDELAAEIKDCKKLRIPDEGHTIRLEKYFPRFIEFIREADSEHGRVRPYHVFYITDRYSYFLYFLFLGMKRSNNYVRQTGIQNQSCPRGQRHGQGFGRYQKTDHDGQQL